MADTSGFTPADPEAVLAYSGGFGPAACGAQDMEGEMSEQEKSGGIQVIARAAAIMRTLGEHPKGLSLAGIAKQVDLPRSTVQRIITALEEERLVESLGASGGFRLGPALGQLLNQTQSDIVSMVGPVIDAMAARLEESVALASLTGDKIFVIYRAVAERELRIVFPVGIHAPSYATAVGKLLLAQAGAAAADRMLPASWPMHTPFTLDRPALMAQLEQIREQGVAVEEEEYIEGVYSMAVGLDTYLGSYALAVLAPSSRAARRHEVFAEVLAEGKASIERSIGTSRRDRAEQG